MFSFVLLVLGIYVGVPAFAMFCYWAIGAYYDRQIVRDSERSADYV